MLIFIYHFVNTQKRDFPNLLKVSLSIIFDNGINIFQKYILFFKLVSFNLNISFNIKNNKPIES